MSKQQLPFLPRPPAAHLLPGCAQLAAGPGDSCEQEAGCFARQGKDSSPAEGTGEGRSAGLSPGSLSAGRESANPSPNTHIFLGC